MVGKEKGVFLVITLENIGQHITASLEEMQQSANRGDIKKAEQCGLKVMLLAKNSVLLARRRGQESAVLLRRSIGGNEL